MAIRWEYWPYASTFSLPMNLILILIVILSSPLPWSAGLPTRLVGKRFKGAMREPFRGNLS